MRRIYSIAIAVLALALVAAACGDDDDDAAPAPAEPAAAPAEEPMEEPAEEPMEEPAEEPMEEPMEEPAEEPMEEPMEEPAEEPMEEGGTIAFSFGNEQVGIYKIVAGPARLQAEARGYEFLEGAANGDCDAQVRDVENFVVQDVDAIVVVPICGIDALAPTLEDAEAKGIVVVGYASEIPETGDGAILWDNRGAGESVAAEALRWFNEDFTGDQNDFSWVLFTYDGCGQPCTDRTDPIRDIITAATGVAPLESEAISIPQGLDDTQVFFQSNPNIAMVIGVNDAGAMGAYEAILGEIEAGRDASTFFVAGIDGQNEALELVAAGGGEGGIYRASSSLLLHELGQTVVDLPADILEGKIEAGSADAVVHMGYQLMSANSPQDAQDLLDLYAAFTGG